MDTMCFGFSSSGGFHWSSDGKGGNSRFKLTESCLLLRLSGDFCVFPLESRSCFFELLSCRREDDFQLRNLLVAESIEGATADTALRIDSIDLDLLGGLLLSKLAGGCRVPSLERPLIWNNRLDLLEARDTFALASVSASVDELLK